MNLGDLYRKYINGKSLSDDELRVGKSRFTRLLEDLDELGPEFKIHANEIRRVLYQFESFIEARKQR